MIFDDEHSAREFILSCGAQIEVIAPTDLRAQVIHAAEQIVALYAAHAVR